MILLSRQKMGLSGTGTVSEGIEGAHGLPVSCIDDGSEPEPRGKLQKPRIDEQQDREKTRESENAGWRTSHATPGNIKKKISPIGLTLMMKREKMAFSLLIIFGKKRATATYFSRNAY
jgi:hypothetical protein